MAYEATDEGGHSFRNVGSFEQADRAFFVCPACFISNGGFVGTHSIAIDRVGGGTPDDACIHNNQDQPVRWAFSGSSLEDLTLAPSIQILGGCNWHGFVRNGAIEHA